MEIIKECIKDENVFRYGLDNFDFSDKKFYNLDSSSVLKIKSKDELRALDKNLSESLLEQIADKTFDANSLSIICYIQSEGKSFGKIKDNETEQSVDILATWCDVYHDNGENNFETFEFINTDNQKELDAIVDEMISKLSAEEIHATLSLINYAYGLRRSPIKQDIAEKYLRTWAENKAFMYLAMGRNLIISKDVVVECNPDELQHQWISTSEDFLFGSVLRQVSKNNISENSIQLGDMLNYFYRCFSPNDCVEIRRLKSLVERNGEYTQMKLTKVIAKVFEDEKMNIEYSKVLQGKTQRHNLKISIHPLDYLTCSMSKKWESCHRPTGMYQGGPISYMLDNATVMSYTNSDDMCLSESKGINFDNFVDDNWKNFKWNNKKWRSLFYVNSKTFAATFYREYPSPIGNMADICRAWYEELISNYLNKENLWEDRKMFSHLKDKTSLHYNDPIQFKGRTETGKKLHYVSLPFVDYRINTIVGHEAFALDTGELTSKRQLKSE